MPNEKDEPTTPHGKAQKEFHDTVGRVLTYLDEANTGKGTKKAVRAEIYELFDKKISPLIDNLMDKDQEESIDDTKFNR